MKIIEYGEKDMLKVGLVGYGFMGGMHSQCYEATGEAKIVAITDVEADRRASAKEKYGCNVYASMDEMLASEKLDIVDICTPTYLHEECVIKAAATGVNIMCEKPMALDVESCDRMIAAVEKSGSKFMIGQVIRFWPEYQVVKEIADSGKYGKIRWVSAKRLSPPATWAWQGWLYDESKSGGAILDLHIHDLDYICYLIGMPTNVLAAGVNGPGGGIDTAFTTGTGHANGAVSYAEGSLDMAGYPFTMGLTVVFEKATAKLDTTLTPSLVIYTAEGEEIVPDVPEVSVGASSESGGNISSLGGYFLELQYFVNCVKNNKFPQIVTPADARESVRYCLASKKSIVSGAVANP